MCKPCQRDHIYIQKTHQTCTTAKQNPIISIQYSRPLGLSRGRKEHKHPKVRLIHLKYKIQPPAIISANFLNPLYCRAVLNILYAVFTFLFDDLFWNLKVRTLQDVTNLCTSPVTDQNIVQKYMGKAQVWCTWGEIKSFSCYSVQW